MAGKIKPTKAEKDARRAAGIPERFADVPLEEIPRGLQRRLERMAVPDPPPLPVVPPQTSPAAPPVMVTADPEPLVPLIPKSTDDPAGDVGNVAADGDFLYVKTESGWKRSPLKKF